MIGAEVRQSERVEMLLADVCRHSGGIFGAPSLKEFAAMLEKHGLELRDAPTPTAGVWWTNSALGAP